MQLSSLSLSTNRTPLPTAEQASRGDGRAASAANPQPSHQVSEKAKPVRGREGANQQQHRPTAQQAGSAAIANDNRENTAAQAKSHTPASNGQEEKRRSEANQRRASQAASAHAGDRANRAYREAGARSSGKMLDEIV